MAYLLLKKDEQELKKEYAFRFLNVTLAVVICLVILSAISIIPALANIYVKQQALEIQNKEFVGSDVLNDRDKYRELALELNRIVNFFDTDEKKVSELITTINKYNDQGIQIQSYTINLTDDMGGIEIRGFALNRNALVSFASTLGNEGSFLPVRVPVSNFTKDTNLPFSLKIEFAEENDE